MSVKEYLLAAALTVVLLGGAIGAAALGHAIVFGHDNEITTDEPADPVMSSTGQTSIDVEAEEDADRSDDAADAPDVAAGAPDVAADPQGTDGNSQSDAEADGQADATSPQDHDAADDGAASVSAPAADQPAGGDASVNVE